MCVSQFKFVKYVFYCGDNINLLLSQPFSAQMAGLDEKSGLGSQVGLMPGSVVSADFTDKALVENNII